MRIPILILALALAGVETSAAATYLLLSQTNTFAAGITNAAKAYTDAHSGGSTTGVVSNNVVSSGLVSVDSSKTNVIAATKAHITNAWAIFDGDTAKFVNGAGNLGTPSSDNWVASGTTNSTLPGFASADQMVATNGIPQAGPTNMVRIGVNAADSFPVDDSIIAIGYNAARLATGSVYSVSVGRHAGYEGHGANQVNIGHAAGQYGTNGAGAVRIGYLAGQFATNSGNAVIIGPNASRLGRFPQNGVIIGTTAGENATSSQSSILIGPGVANLATGTLDSSIMIGQNAGFNAVDSGNSIFIGQQAGRYITADSRLAIDSNTSFSTNSGALIYGEFDNRKLAINGKLATMLTVGSAATLGAHNTYLVNVDAQTVTLPTAVGQTGVSYIIKAIAPCTTATIATTSSQLIDGSSTYSLSASNKFVRVASDGANWWVLGSN